MSHLSSANDPKKKKKKQEEEIECFTSFPPFNLEGLLVILQQPG